MKWVVRLVGSVALALAPGLSSAASEPPPRVESLEMFVGDARVLEGSARRVVVGNGKLLSITQVETGKLLLVATAPGATAVQVWGRNGGVRQLQVAISESSPSLLRDQVASLLGDIAKIRTRMVGERVLIEGQRLSSAEHERVAAVAKTWSGKVFDFTDRVGWDDMLLIEVKILELRRSASDRLGIRWDYTANGPAAQVRDGAGGGRTLHLQWNGELASRLDLLRARGEARIVAEPNLSCRSGGNARFVSGGELPVPVVNAQGTPDVQYREYGVILDIKPSVDQGGNVYAQIDTEVSDVDPSVQVMNVPAILKRRSMTEVNVRLGETVVIAGLLDRSTGREHSGLPGLSRLPLAGGLFRSSTRTQQDSELVVLITPRLLAPAPAEAPTDANAVWMERGRKQQP